MKKRGKRIDWRSDSELVPVADLVKMNWDSEERRKNAENWDRQFRENVGIIEI